MAQLQIQIEKLKSRASKNFSPSMQSSASLHSLDLNALETPFLFREKGHSANRSNGRSSTRTAMPKRTTNSSQEKLKRAIPTTDNSDLIPMESQIKCPKETRKDSSDPYVLEVNKAANMVSNMAQLDMRSLKALRYDLEMQIHENLNGFDQDPKVKGDQSDFDGSPKPLSVPTPTPKIVRTLGQRTTDTGLKETNENGHLESKKENASFGKRNKISRIESQVSCKRLCFCCGCVNWIGKKKKKKKIFRKHFIGHISGQ